MPRMTTDDFDEGAMFAALPPATRPAGNPLARYFRIPGEHITLPTGGAFLPPGTFHPDPSGDVPVLPMRAADELLMRSPDALMSGYAIEKLIESCVPAIKSPRDISMPDLDVILLAIRASSYGEKMEITVDCPSCKHENAFDVDLPGMMSTMRRVPPENVVRLNDDVLLYVRPFRLTDATAVSLATFNETRKVQAAEDDKSLSDSERAKVFNESVMNISQLNMKITADCVIKVVIPDGTVTDRAQIAEFVTNMPRKWFTVLDEKIKEINALGIDKNISVTCQKCSHEWTTEVQFDPANFFAPGS